MVKCINMFEDDKCHFFPIILGSRHPSRFTGCICEAPAAAAHTVEVSSAAPGKDPWRSWGLYDEVLCFTPRFSLRLSQFSFKIKSVTKYLQYKCHNLLFGWNVLLLMNFSPSFFLACPSVQPQTARAKPSLLSAPCGRGPCSAAPLLMSDQHEETGSRCAQRNTLPLHSSGACWGTGHNSHLYQAITAPHCIYFKQLSSLGKSTVQPSTFWVKRKSFLKICFLSSPWLLSGCVT